MKILIHFFSILLTSIILSSNVSAASLVLDQTGAPYRSGGYTGGLVFQSFTPTQNNIAGLDVDFYNFQGTKDLTLKIGTSLGSSGVNSTLLTMTQSVSSCGHLFSDLACVEFRFSPIGITPNQLLFMEFSWDGTGLNGGAIGAARGDKYSGGQVSCSSCGNTQGGDVAFRTYSSVSAVPTPSAAILFAPALIGLMGLRKKTKA